MKTNTEIGQKAERLAKIYLEEKGYVIIALNWRYKRAEIDIIAKLDEILVFVEVKARSYDFYGKPEESISDKKEAMIMDAAQRYMEKIGHDWEIRFDILSIILDKSMKAHKIEHFEDAFFH